MPLPQWLAWAQRLQAIAQTGLFYAKDPFDIQRFSEVRKIASEMIAVPSGYDALSITGLFSSEHGYATPKVDVRAAVFDRGRVLLVREKEDGLYTLPGGWADVGESPAECVLKEVREESGYSATIRKVAAIYDRARHDHPPIPWYCYKLFFVCDLAGGEATDSIETSGAAFFNETELPPLSLTRVTEIQVRHMFDHYRHPEWPTSYD
jgi:ADP-ribose pyrophosphatase YjhB (NUDIX family)